MKSKADKFKRQDKGGVPPGYILQARPVNSIVFVVVQMI